MLDSIDAWLLTQPSLVIARALRIATAVEAKEIAWSTAQQATCGQGLGNNGSDRMVVRDMRARISQNVTAK
jgi:hypothetical protein